MHADLHALRQVGAFRYMRTLAGLDVDRRHLAVLGLEHVDLRGEAELLRGEQEPSRLQRLIRVQLLRRGEGGRRPVLRRAMAAPSGGGIGIAGPFAMAPFEHGEPRAIDPLVDHAGGNENFVRSSRRGEEGQLGLVGAWWRTICIKNGHFKPSCARRVLGLHEKRWIDDAMAERELFRLILDEKSSVENSARSYS